MTTWQLSCAHWQTEPDNGQHSIGGPLGCTRCRVTTTVITGSASGPLFGVIEEGRI